MAAVVAPLRGRSAGRSFDNVDHWLEQVDKYADPHVQKVWHHNSERLLRCRLTAVLPAVCVCVACSCSWGTRAT